MQGIDTGNHYEVDSTDRGVWMFRPPEKGKTLTHDDAMVLGAHLIAHGTFWTAMNAVELLFVVGNLVHGMLARKAAVLGEAPASSPGVIEGDAALAAAVDRAIGAGDAFQRRKALEDATDPAIGSVNELKF